jgi:hypothetical protein
VKENPWTKRTFSRAKPESPFPLGKGLSGNGWAELLQFENDDQ